MFCNADGGCDLWMRGFCESQKIGSCMNDCYRSGCCVNGSQGSRLRMRGQSISAERTAERRFAETLASLNILQLVLIHAEIVSQFMDDRQTNLFADFGLAGADRFNILLIKHDVIRPRR